MDDDTVELSDEMPVGLAQMIADGTKALTMSAELAAMLEENDADARRVDPRTIPTRFSLLKAMALSPAHYLAQAQRPQDDSIAARLAAAITTPKRSDALSFGTACHAMLFGTGTIASFDGRRVGPAWRDAQKRAHDEGHVEILPGRQYHLANQLVGAVKRNPTAMRLLFDGTLVEQRIDWSWMEKACRSTPDARSPKHVVDLKTAISAQPEAFRRASLRMHYEAQASFYGTAIEESGGTMPADFYIVAVEKSEPFPVTVFRFPAETLDLGAKLCHQWFERLLNCERNNVWPEYAPSPAIVDLHLDSWMRDEDDGDDAAPGRSLVVGGERIAL